MGLNLLVETIGEEHVHPGDPGVGRFRDDDVPFFLAAADDAEGVTMAQHQPGIVVHLVGEVAEIGQGLDHRRRDLGHLDAFQAWMQSQFSGGDPGAESHHHRRLWLVPAEEDREVSEEFEGMGVPPGRGVGFAVDHDRACRLLPALFIKGAGHRHRIGDAVAVEM